MATNSTTESRGLLLDSFGRSDLDFDEWLEEIALKGLVVIPELTEDGIKFMSDDSSWYITIRSVGCAQIIGNPDVLLKTKEHFCGDFIQNAAQMYAQNMEMDVSRLICQHNRLCQLGLRATMNYFKVSDMVQDITGFCNNLFDKLHKICPQGGVAQVEIQDELGNTEQSEIENSFMLNYDTCEESPTQECFEWSPPELRRRR